jgi:D-glycero-D-manno-heptose 1,7-bisphosphate phosphatase
MSGRFPLFLDRDGTVIVDRHYLHDPADVVLEDGAVAGLRALVAMGAIPVIVTNQSGVGRGMFGGDAVRAVHDRLDQMLRAADVAIAGYYFCPHAPDDGCACRKPKPGMAIDAARELSLRLDDAIVVGDKMSDLEFAQGIGARGILVKTGKGMDCADRARDAGFDVVDDLAAVARLLHERRSAPQRKRD